MTDRRRVLVVDDDAALLGVVAAVLEQAGYAVTTLTRSADVGGVLRAQPPDLMITDMWMPGGWDGATVIAVARALGYTRPILILTALEERDGSLAGHRLLHKPFEAAALLQAVAELIGPAEAP